MPATCGICGHRYTKEAPMNFSYYKVPKKPPERTSAWADVLRSCRKPDDQVTDSGELWQPTRHHRVCAKHFVTGKPNDNPEHPDYLPNQHLEGLKSKKLALSIPPEPERRIARLGRPPGSLNKKPKLEFPEPPSPPERTPPPQNVSRRYTLSNYVKGEDQIRTFSCLLPRAILPETEEKGTQTLNGSLLDSQLMKSKVTNLEREIKRMEKERDQQSLQIQELQAENRRLMSQTENTYYICYDQ